MKKNIIIIAVIFTLSVYTSYGQISGYASAALGYYSNPLYTYLMQSSNAKQGYLELGYDKNMNFSSLSFKYVGSLSVFDKIQDRNYYEHRLSGNYSFVFGKKSDTVLGKLIEKDSTAEDSTEAGETDTETFQKFDDSLYKYLNLNITGGSRINKPAFKEFDNWGTAFSLSYRFMLNNIMYLKFADYLNYREYKIVPALSNLSNLFSLIIGNRTSKTTNYGLSLSLGFKHFTKKFADTVFDQSLFIVNQKKGGSFAVLSHVENDTSYFLSITPQPDDLIQLTPLLFYSGHYGNSELTANVHYHYNFKKKARFITQSYVSAYVNEDLYNDSYSFGGLGFDFGFKQLLPLKLQSSLTLGIQQKQFGFPAFNLVGEQIYDSRFDLRTNLDFYLSRYFEVYKDLGLDLSFLAGYYRNQSTDQFNNYYLYYYMFAVGIGF